MRRNWWSMPFWPRCTDFNQILMCTCATNILTTAMALTKELHQHHIAWFIKLAKCSIFWETFKLPVPVKEKQGFHQQEVYWNNFKTKHQKMAGASDSIIIIIMVIILRMVFESYGEMFDSCTYRLAIETSDTPVSPVTQHSLNLLVICNHCVSPPQRVNTSDNICLSNTFISRWCQIMLCKGFRVSTRW